MNCVSSKLNRINALLMLAIFLLLDFSYHNSIIEMYEYYGFKLVKVSIFKELFSYLAVVIIIYLINFKNNTKLAQFVLQLIAVLQLFPAIILFKNANTNPQILLAHIIYIFTVYIFLNNIKFRFKTSKVSEDKKMLYLLIITIIFTIPIVLTYKGDINLRNLFLEDIYETRLHHKGMGAPIMGYLHPWLARVIVPLALIFSISKKYKFTTLFLIITLLYLFLIGANKVLLLSIIIILFFYYVSAKYILFSLNIGVVLLLLFGVVLYATRNDNSIDLVSNLITRRVFFTPALLDTCYFDFFKDNPLYWSHSIFKSLIEYPYYERPTVMIASTYFRTVDMSANNGIISDGYSNLGWGGIIINIVVASAVWSFFNSLNINNKYFGVFFLFLFSLVSSALPTVLLTHGGLLLMVISQFFLKDTSNDITKYS